MPGSRRGRPSPHRAGGKRQPPPRPSAGTHPRRCPAPPSCRGRGRAARRGGPQHRRRVGPGAGRRGEGTSRGRAARSGLTRQRPPPSLRPRLPPSRETRRLSREDGRARAQRVGGASAAASAPRRPRPLRLLQPRSSRAVTGGASSPALRGAPLRSARAGRDGDQRTALEARLGGERRDHGAGDTGISLAALRGACPPAAPP